jgi:hypothetical protein
MLIQCIEEFQMKRAVLVPAAIAVALSAYGALPMAFGATLSTPPHHHERVRRDRHSVADRAVAKAAHSDQRISGEERTQASAGSRQTVHDPKFLGMDAKVGPPSVEWDCGNGDAGCSWHPYGWEGTRN